jgi:hydrogenase maturation factor
MHLRLKYVGIKSTTSPDTASAIRQKLSEGCKNLYVLVNYTALYDAHKLLQEMEKKYEH